MRIDKSKFELAKARSCVKQKEFEEAGISRSTISRSLSRGVQPCTVGRIAKVLNCDVTEIIAK